MSGRRTAEVFNMPMAMMCGLETEKEISRDGSHYSIFSGILPSLGARSTRRVMLRWFIVSPYDRRYRAWETFLIVLVIYSAWVSPFEFGFLGHPRGTLALVDNIVNAFFAIDIILTFFVAYLDRTTYLMVDDPKLIAWKYLTTWFVLDVASTIPSELALILLPHKLRSYGFFNMLRLWRLRRVSALFARYHNPSRTWIGSSMPDFHQQSLLIRYVTSVYWSITTLATVGYGDLHARDTIQVATGFAQRNQLPERLQEQMISHLSLKFRTNSEGIQQQETLDALPKAIRSSITHYLFYSLVQRVYLFYGVSNDLLFQLVSEMKAEYYPPREDVILQNEAPTDFYILVTGTAIVRIAQKGDLLGEIGVLCYRPQFLTVRTRSLCQLLRLNRTTFLSIVQSNVGDGTIIISNLLQYLKDQRDNPLMEGLLKEIENMLTRGRLDLPLTLCFAILREDDFLLHQLLRRGLDPNESDNNGHTALHMAASKGSEHCVRLLLDYDAEPNSKDSEGSVPLWEAILGKHEQVAKLLSDHGAELSAGDMAYFACTAAEQSSLDLLEACIRYGGDVKAAKKDGTTALHRAVCDGNLAMVEFLLRRGANMDAADDQGWTPPTTRDGRPGAWRISRATTRSKLCSNP
ncbi:hypothetical protein ZIOFF_002032 [Zingiber officinale]|uniref:Potassium channel n=1 Tax=Zingiber officinale TaxID=94328 RepID=A0A8J5LSM0_ZINOF|nr:hypothetical protein ZIOFF_002032 [Zingiber officinale]